MVRGCVIVRSLPYLCSLCLEAPAMFQQFMLRRYSSCVIVRRSPIASVLMDADEGRERFSISRGQRDPHLGYKHMSVISTKREVGNAASITTYGLRHFISI